MCVVRYDLGREPVVHVADAADSQPVPSTGSAVDLSGTVIDDAARSRRPISAPHGSFRSGTERFGDESVVALPLSEPRSAAVFSSRHAAATARGEWTRSSN